VEGVEAAGDEGVVDGADGGEGLVEEVGGDAEGAEEEEEVVFRDAELEVAAGGGLAPLDGDGDAGVGEEVGEGLGGVDAGLADPAAEVGGDGDVGGGGDEAAGEVGLAGEVDEDLAEGLLGGEGRREGGGEGDGEGGLGFARGGFARGEAIADLGAE